MSTDGRLDPAELSQWEAWKRAVDAVQDTVAAAIVASSGLSVADFSVLTRLQESGGGSLRQNQLAASLRWERSRLSRQLSRMADRGLLRSEGTGAGQGRLITITDDGASAVARARPAHATAVREALLERGDADRRPAFWDVLRAVAGGTPATKEHSP